MASTHLYQIFYSDETRQGLDPGFIPLDNSANAKPDWREYWPIRNYLLNTPLIEGDYYGFFSPMFKEKTRLDAAQTHAFILEPGPEPEVVIFSPMWDMSAFFLNVFEQSNACHPGMYGVASDFFQRIRPGVRLGEIMTDSRNTVFCNYFAAKPPFWRAWLKIGEELFTLAETGDDDLAARLNSVAYYHDTGLQRKVFIMERIATFILATEPAWKTKAFSPFRLSSSPNPIGQFHLEAVLNDALKIAYGTQPFPEYRDAFLFVRRKIVALLQPKA